MNHTSNRRARHAAIIVIAAAIASAIGFGPATVAGQEPLPEACAFQDRSPNGARVSELSCEPDADDEYVTCSYYEDAHGRVRVVYESDQYCLSYAAIEEARIEAAGWPDYDSTAISDAERNIAVDAATREAAGWPDYDSTAISAGGSTDITSNSPRMTQIGAQATSGVGDEVASSYDAPVAQSPQQTAF
jgi:hypothetical protein